MFRDKQLVPIQNDCQVSSSVGASYNGNGRRLKPCRFRYHVTFHIWPHQVKLERVIPLGGVRTPETVAIYVSLIHNVNVLLARTWQPTMAQVVDP